MKLPTYYKINLLFRIFKWCDSNVNCVKQFFFLEGSIVEYRMIADVHSALRSLRREIGHCGCAPCRCASCKRARKEGHIPRMEEKIELFALLIALGEENFIIRGKDFPFSLSDFRLKDLLQKKREQFADVVESEKINRKKQEGESDEKIIKTHNPVGHNTTGGGSRIIRKATPFS